jgi:hypothetical protein
MHHREVFHSHFLPSFDFMHGARQRALGHAVRAVVQRGAALSVTSIGRCWGSAAGTKHAIKAADRLVGNHHLAAEAEAVFQRLAARILAPHTRPVVLVDWSDAHPDRKMQILRATVCFQRRSLVLYERVFRLSQYNSHKAHRRFLRGLARILPEGVVPILVTDAGFRNPWFRAVRAMGWHFLGRLRSTVQWCAVGQACWQTLPELHARARRCAQALGRGLLAREHSMEGHLYLAPRPHKTRGKAARSSHTRNDQRHRKSHWQPWVLFSSLELPATDILGMYRQRMSIEAGFRDLKSARFGLGMEYGRVSTLARLTVLLLIAALAIWVLAWIGWLARQAGISHRLQANTVRHTEVLSVSNIARILFLRPEWAEWLRQCRWDQEFVGIG